MPEKKPADEERSKFREALEKKKQKGVTGSGGGPTGGSKVGEGQMTGGAARRHQRKSGSA